MFRHIFTVRKTEKAPAVKFTVDMPSSLEDADLIRKRFGTPERMIAQACRQWTVSVAVGIRKRLPDEAKAEAYASHYCDNGAKDTFVQTISVDKAEAEEHGFTEEQLAWIAKKGVKVS